MKNMRIWAVIVFVLSVAPVYASNSDASKGARQCESAPWGGFYIGGFGGYIWTLAHSETRSTVTGAYLGSGKVSPSGFLYGGRVGYDHVFASHWLAGIAPEISYSRLKVDRTTVNTTGTNVHHADAEDVLSGALLGRAGYAFKNCLLYGIAGWAWDCSKSTRTQIIGTTGAATAGTQDKDVLMRNGWTVGTGIEVKVVKNWSVYTEYRYTDYAKDKVTFLAAQQVSDSRGYSHLVQTGINYKF